MIMPDKEWIEIRLVPVEVFGADDCCQHGIQPCDSDGYGLMDAVGAWSDCNRARGRIYRVDETDPKYRQPGDTVKIRVRTSDLTFFERKFGED